MDPGTAYTVVTTVGGAVMKLGGLGASYIYPAMGFSATGIVKGSLAAAAQSSIPNVVAGSTFSAMQAASTGAAAIGTAVGLPAVSTTIAAGGLAYGAYRVWRVLPWP